MHCRNISITYPRDRHKLFNKIFKSALRPDITSSFQFYSTEAGANVTYFKDTSLESIPQAYKPKDFEFGCYEWWERNGYFLPSNQGQKFSLLLPPPNVTGTLHLGHAFTGTIQDIISRWKRMQGFSVLWLPGMDHAGIATQVVVEKKLMKQLKKTKHDLGKEDFIRHIWEWKNEKEGTIVAQLKMLGLSLDWTKNIFTMAPESNDAVKETFIRLFDAGLIYRSDCLVNWCCALQSTISDIEVDTLEIKGPTTLQLPNCKAPVEFGFLTEIAYKLHNADGEIVVATTRPETFIGDTAVALHPNDSRRSALEGLSVWHPFQCRPIPIIFDDLVDPNFGTGAVKITPAHDPLDWEIGKKHNLPTVQVFDESGMIVTSKFKGMQRYDARSAVLLQLKHLGLLRGRKNHDMLLPVCSRSGDIVELMSKPQWFLNCKVAAQKAIDFVKKGELKIIPPNYEKIWFHWLENIKDWNISRQLWWGQSIPAFEIKTDDKKSVWVAACNEKDAKKKAALKLGVSLESISSIEADQDVLDTWFSSSVFPFYALGWPKSRKDFNERFPYPVLDTAHDILFFWVARMVMMSIMLTDGLPFNNILLHGIICDARGRKMSKSLGNVVAPEDIIRGATLQKLANDVKNSHQRGLIGKEEYKISLEGQKKLFPDGIPECGVDALRFTLSSLTIQSNFVSFDVSQCHTNKLFCNKILQAFKFFVISLKNEKVPPSFHLVKKSMNSFDLWILSRLATAVLEVNESLDSYQLQNVTSALKRFFYYEMCDVYLEACKPVLLSDDESAKATTLTVLFRIFETGLKLLHPVMPFLTEDLYQRLPSVPDFDRKESIMIAPYPTVSEWQSWANPDLNAIVNLVNEIISAARKTKALFGTKGEKPTVLVTTGNKSLVNFISSHYDIVTTLCRADSLTVLKDTEPLPQGNYHQQTVNKNTMVHAGFQGNKHIWLNRLQPTLNRENKLLKQLSQVQELLSRKKCAEELSEEAKNRNMEKLKTIQRELEKIEEIKKFLQ